LAGKLAKDASDGADQLERQFDKAKEALDRKAKDSGANKQRAERLRERARALAEAAAIKYKVSRNVMFELESKSCLS